MGPELLHWLAHGALGLLLAVATSIIAKLLVDKRRENEIRRLLHIIDGRLAALTSHIASHGETLADIEDDLDPPRDARGRFSKREGA